MDRQAGPAFPRGLGTGTHGHAAESESASTDVRAPQDDVEAVGRGVLQDRPVTTGPGRAASAEPPPTRGPLCRWLRARPADVIDVFVYVVVLNLAIEYVPSVISEGFTLSLLTAVLLKLVLEVVIILKTRVIDRGRAATTKRGKGAAAVTLWAVAAGSKFVVLKLVDLVFGDAVSLGGFIPVTLLVLGLLASRAAVRRLLYDTPTPV